MRSFVLTAAVLVASACNFSSDLDFNGSSGASGGPNGPAPTPCTTAAECGAGVCVEGGCFPATAADGKKNGSETDVDCGGSAAPPCATGKACSTGTDCASVVCAGGVCQEATPSDGVKNGGETDVDCGGTAAPGCLEGMACVLGHDCASGVCVGGACKAGGVGDGVKNGSETDIDCGGTEAPACTAGAACLQGSDCTSTICTANVCQPATAHDGIKNGNESDIDCGRTGQGEDTQAPGCAVGKVCLAHGDCASNGCQEDGANAGRCAEAASCTRTDGAYTCGSGEVGAAGAQHESCCRSLPVAGFTDNAFPGKQVLLDKYEITAGRMRRFIERMAEANNGNADVRSWIQQNPPVRWNPEWTKWSPRSSGGSYGAAGSPERIDWDNNTVESTRWDEWGTDGAQGGLYVNVGSDYIFGLGGYYFYVHGHNCDTSAGYPTFWYDEAVTRQKNGGPRARVLSQADLDRRSMNCAPLAMLAAFCAWDGGQLATSAVLAHVSGVPWANRDTTATGVVGNLPARSTANFTGDAGGSPTVYNVPANTEGAARIAPPGRMVNDQTRLAANGEPWMDLRGNLQESAIRETANPLTFAGVHYDGIGRNSNRTQRNAQAVYPEFKAGTVGGRCMRYVDP